MYTRKIRRNGKMLSKKLQTDVPHFCNERGDMILMFILKGLTKKGQ